MSLSSIKLSGFKSFVEVTTVPFVSELTAVVGPNGAGKSNIFDAVRWVMGESSAKQLRGESMEDIIFNGSESRKAVGQASIELNFDNSNGLIKGPYANYSEISIRRVVTRDGSSDYYLNGSRCRRKDIVDVFLGTGLGSRSYALIGQGAISQLIEAKPEDLRVYLEEAAGISKYKERRRETENRMRHSKENLARLNDLRDEVSKQLSHLKRQANDAERYKTFKQDERLLKAKLLTLQWQEIEESHQQTSAQISKQETELESVVANKTKNDAKIEQVREEKHTKNDQFNEIQESFYATGAEIAKLEQMIQGHQERHKQLELDHVTLVDELEDLKQTLQDAEIERDQLEKEKSTLQPEIKSSKKTADEEAKQLSELETKMHAWQEKWETFVQRENESQSQLQYLEQQIKFSSEQQQRLQNEISVLNESELREKLDSVKEKLNLLNREKEDKENEFAAFTQSILQAKTVCQETQSKLNQLQSETQTLQSKLASLETLQDAVLRKDNDYVNQWLDENKLTHASRLIQALEVESPWEHAVEMVLGFYLDGVIVDDVTSYLTQLKAPFDGQLTLLSQPDDSEINKTAGDEKLSSKLKSDIPAKFLLENICLSESHEDAVAQQAKLGPHESVITKDGVWLGPNWVRIVGETDSTQSGMISREHEIKEIKDLIAAKTIELEKMTKELDRCNTTLEQQELQKDKFQMTLSDITVKATKIENEIEINQHQLDQLLNRKETIDSELSALAGKISADEKELLKINEALKTSNPNDEAQTRQNLINERDSLQEQLEDCRVKSKDAQESAHQLEMQHHSIITRFQTTIETIERLSQQIQLSSQKQEKFDEQLIDMDTPLQTRQDELDAALSKRVTVENELKSVRTQLEELDGQLSELDTKNHEYSEAMDQVRQTIEDERIHEKEIQVRQQTIQEQISSTQHNLEELLKQILPDETASEVSAALEKLITRVERLGPINLAAIDEFASITQRKEYLDSQFDDLTTALETLTNAIHKIDQESKARFKDIFAKVNDSLQEMFPKLFGGGKAMLTLDSDDLLSTGVNVIASPPGKRNTHIHMLSGGEKAMTAIALVFALFQLNPAPFCMLDEVDASLDDENAWRFCNLVKEMSKKTQFIFVTHNKITMEMAQQLIGVTMHEPGVSRLVTVDIDEATAMAGN